MFSNCAARRAAASRADVVAVIGVVSVLGSLVGLSLPGLDQFPREYSQEALCQMKLAKLGYGLFMCRAENNGRGPMSDDGGAMLGSCDVMLTWADVLYDTGYIGRADLQLCPTDARPDSAASIRGTSWMFSFVDEFGVGEPLKPGVRTSYAINDVITYGWDEDLYPDASRQIYVADGWWTWLMNTSAWWQAAEDLGYSWDVAYPNWGCTMIGYRHPGDSANMLFMDGGVRTYARRIPTSLSDLRANGSFDTLQAFTWLPGERDFRIDNDPYRGSIYEFRGLVPRFAATGGWGVSSDVPDHLKPQWRTENDAWVKLPNRADRCSKLPAIPALDAPALTVPASGIAKPAELATGAMERETCR